jgi:hypothetical protein
MVLAAIWMEMVGLRPLYVSPDMDLKCGQIGDS